MAQLTITIPNAILDRVLNGFCENQGYSPTLDTGESNPETQQQFIKRKVIQYIKNAVKESEIEKASNLAAGTASTSAETDIQLT